MPKRSPNKKKLPQSSRSQGNLFPSSLALPNDPPALKAKPWCSSLVGSTGVYNAGASPLIITVADIRLRITRSYTDVAPSSLRLASMKFWITTADTTGKNAATQNYPFTIELYDPSTAQNSLLMSQVDIGTLVRPAKMGFRFGSIKEQEILTATSTAKVAQVDYSSVITGLNTIITWQCQVLWRG